MRRREALRVLGAGIALPVLGHIRPDDLAALGVQIRAGVLPKPVTGQLTYLDAHQNATVTTIADLILPRTDTPGAVDVGVNEFIDLIVGSWYGDRERGDFIVGLERIDEMARSRSNRNFVDLPVDEQVAVLSELEVESFALKDAQDQAEERRRGPGPYPFPTHDRPPGRSDDAPSAPSDLDSSETPWDEHIFQRLKYLTLHGYYTSREGMVEELHFEMIPGAFGGCVPNEEVHGHPTPDPRGLPPAGGAAASVGGRPARSGSPPGGVGGGSAVTAVPTAGGTVG